MLTLSVKVLNGLLHARIDPDDEDLVTHKWHMSGGKAPKGQVNHGKYVATSVVVEGKRRTAFLHRVVAARMGLVPDPFTSAPTLSPGQWQYSIDHINGDKLDNRRKNLRLRDRRQQMTNSNDGLRVNNVSGFRGVSHSKRHANTERPWRATTTENGRSITLGYFATREEAARARQSYDTAPSKTVWLNARRPRAVGASGFRGVQAAGGRFYAKAFENGRTIALGGYDTAEDAAAARANYLASGSKATA